MANSALSHVGLIADHGQASPRKAQSRVGSSRQAHARDFGSPKEGGQDGEAPECQKAVAVWGHWQGGHAMSQTTRQQITGKALSLADAAAHLGWSRRTLIRALVRYGIPTIGSGRRARLEMADLELLKAKERGLSGISSAPQEPARTVGVGLPVGARIDERERAYWRRRLGHLNRKKREPTR